MPIRFKCGECGAAMTIKDELAWTKGKCPKCKTAFQVPGSASATPAPPAEISEEDAIFGKDFFSQNEPARPRYIAPDDDDDSDDAPVKPPKKTAPTPPPSPADNSASIAGALLSKTGKKNRAIDYVEPEPGKVEYDFTELKYRLKHQVLPLVGVLLVVAPLLYYMINSMFGDGVALPDLAPVSGNVTLDGRPVAARIDFVPVVEKSMLTGSSVAQAGPDGVYVAFFNPDNEGAVVGQNQIRIKAGGHTFNLTLEVPGDGVKHDFTLTTPGGAASASPPQQ